MTDLSTVELLFGHTSEDTAYLVDDYPYGRRVRTQIRYWIETNAKHGDRFCSQTLNPKTGRWNKPKKSTYTGVGIMFHHPGASKAELAELEALGDRGLDYAQERRRDELRRIAASEGHVKWAGTNFNDRPEYIAAFLGAVGRERLTEQQRRKVVEIIGYTRAMSKVTWTIRANVTAEEAAAIDADQKVQEQRLGKLIALETHYAGKEFNA